MQPHFLLCGLGKVGWRVLEYLRKAGARVTVIDIHCDPGDPRLAHVTALRGDCRQESTLTQAGLADARGIIVLTSDDLINLSTALMARQLHPTIRVVVRMFNQDLIKRLGTQNMHALSTSALASPLLATIARTGEALGAFRLTSGSLRQIAEVAVGPQSPLAGQTLGALPAVVVAHVPAGMPARFIQDLDRNLVVQAGDRVVLCGEPATLTALAADDDDSPPDRLWAGLVRRSVRVLLRTLRQIDWPVTVCTSIFLGVIVVSVIVFTFGMKQDTPIDAFFRTISLLATGADMHGEDVEPGSWQKAFIGALRLIGTGLTAAFTAIFTNYLIRANLSSALEVRRIPEGGHIVVCGLGNVGFRVVEELRAQGELVVAIERDEDSVFVASARRLGAAVIVGDATVVEVLRQAHVPTARALVAATSNDLINLEIALLVRELKPRQRVLVRLADPHLARTLRQAANVRLALSIPELAAPAFVASLYGNQVRSLLQIEGSMLAVCDLTIHDARLASCPISDLGSRWGFLPIHVTDANGKVRPLAPETIIALGDQVTGIIAIENVQRLFQDEAQGASQIG